MNKSEWVWMPHPAHFCGGQDCHFVLATKVKDVIVSTVGEYKPRWPETSILMRADEFQNIGAHRKFETMVFKARPSDVACCPWVVDVVSGDLDFRGYMTAGDAYKGHMELCEKWANGDGPRLF